MRSFRRLFHGASSERVYPPCAYHGFTGGGLGLTVLTGDRTRSAPSRAPVLEPGLTVGRERALRVPQLVGTGTIPSGDSDD